MTLTIDIVATPEQREEFITFPWIHYADDPNWIAPLLESECKLLTPGKHPFYEHADVEQFLARRDGAVVGRIAAIVNHAHNEYWKDDVGFFGFFECENESETAGALFDAAAAWLRERRRSVMRGPTNYSTNETCGLLIKGHNRPPCLMMTYNPKYYERLIEGYGFKKAMDLNAWHLNVDIYNPFVFKVEERFMRRGKFTLRDANMRDFKAEIQRIKTIYNRAWADNWGFIPMTDAELDFMAKELKPIVDPHIVHFVEQDGKTVAFSLALPDYNPILQKMNGRLWPFGWRHLIGAKKKIYKLRLITMGILPEYRTLGIDAVLYARLIRKGVAHNYPMGELSWVLESNENMNNSIEKMGSIKYRIYRLFDFDLTAPSE